jgi:hypothetical protein
VEADHSLWRESLAREQRLTTGSAATGALANATPRAPLALAAAVMLLAALWTAVRDAQGAFQPRR